jgi:hypothetical protein
MASRDLYHGAEANKLLFNIRNGSLTADSQGRLFFAQQEWQNCLVHGADVELGESYVAKFRVDIPDDAELAQVPTSGNRDARILRLTPGAQVRAQVLELYVRRGRVGSFETETIPQADVQAYLENKIASVKLNEALRQLADKWQTLWNLYELYSNEHQTQLNLATNSIAGYFVSRFNSPAPPTVIWTNAYGRLLATKRYINQRDVVRATSSLLIARLWYLYALKRYATWKDGIEAAGESAQRAIWATAAAVVVVTVGACLAAGALTGWAGWGAASTATGTATGTTAAEQTLARIAAACANAERAIRVADAAIEEARILEAIAEAEREAAALGG